MSLYSARHACRKPGVITRNTVLHLSAKCEAMVREVSDRKKETSYVKLAVPLHQLHMFKCLESDAGRKGLHGKVFFLRPGSGFNT